MTKRYETAAPPGRVLVYPMVWDDGQDELHVHLDLVDRAKHMLSWAVGEAIVHKVQRTFNGYFIGTVEVDAPPVGGVPLPKPPGRRRRRRQKGERA